MIALSARARKKGEEREGEVLAVTEHFLPRPSPLCKNLSASYSNPEERKRGKRREEKTGRFFLLIIAVLSRHGQPLRTRGNR